MVDFVSYVKIVPNGFADVNLEPDESQCLSKVPNDELHLCPQTVLGYSFAANKWGRFLVHKFQPIEWNPGAFRDLVLSDEKKELIESLVCAKRDGLISDIIPGKSGGSIIILHGPPGTGKTLTAEAAAELSNKPLVVTTAGELGDKAPELESRLQKILKLCELWKAILLIDEAEAYLENRVYGSTMRNAVVSVLLRLFEYHQEVIFLTTNYIGRIDVAFKSRISVAIKYPELDVAKREMIWIRFFQSAGVEIIDCKELVSGANGGSKFTKLQLRTLALQELNGR
jgi:SpoVK/Ycf46/Vps4 family AAA+-type ATPase